MNGSELTGKTVLVLLDRYSLSGEHLGHEHMHGQIISASAHRGITVRRFDDSTFRFPPVFDAFQLCPPGTWKLEMEDPDDPVGTIVVNPHYVSTWQIIVDSESGKETWRKGPAIQFPGGDGRTERGE